MKCVSCSHVRYFYGGGSGGCAACRACKPAALRVFVCVSSMCAFRNVRTHVSSQFVDLMASRRQSATGWTTESSEAKRRDLSLSPRSSPKAASVARSRRSLRPMGHIVLCTCYSYRRLRTPHSMLHTVTTGLSLCTVHVVPVPVGRSCVGMQWFTWVL